MQRLKKYLDRKGTPWRPIEEWSLIFKGNHPDGIFIDAKLAPMSYIKLLGLKWEYRGHYQSVYVYPKEGQ